MRGMCAVPISVLSQNYELITEHESFSTYSDCVFTFFLTDSPQKITLMKKGDWYVLTLC